MKFNGDKSKVMVIGKRIDKRKRWRLGNLDIGECESLKYLGVIFSRSLVDSVHVKQHLKPKAQRLNNYMSSILAGHENVNRVTLGDSVWKYIILPSVAHGSAVWLCNTQESSTVIRSIQYSAARSIMRISATPAIEATLGELGWLPLAHTLDLYRIKFYHRLKFGVDESRLCKIIFRDMERLFQNGDKNSVWPYFKEIEKIFIKVGLDNVMNDGEGDWLFSFKKLSIENYVHRFFHEIDNKSSLSTYRMLKRSSFGEQYLFTMKCFESARLKFKIRTGCLGIQDDLLRWNKVTDSNCPLCHAGNEDLYHFMFLCPSLLTIRQDIWKWLETNLTNSKKRYIWEQFAASSLNSKLCLLLGDLAFDHGDEVGWTFDKACKIFLTEAWKKRTSVVGASYM